MGEHEEDVEELKEILNVVAEKIPKLLNSLTDVLYGKEEAGKYGRAVASFYKELRDAGMTDQQAFEITKQYMSSLNIGGMLSKALGGFGKEKESKETEEIKEDIGKYVRARIKEKLEQKAKKEE